jgi:hypothetical protein
VRNGETLVRKNKLALATRTRGGLSRTLRTERNLVMLEGVSQVLLEGVSLMSLLLLLLLLSKSLFFLRCVVARVCTLSKQLLTTRRVRRVDLDVERGNREEKGLMCGLPTTMTETLLRLLVCFACYEAYLLAPERGAWRGVLLQVR